MNQGQRARVAKDRGLIYKYPRTFVITASTAALLIFFSKPIYDIFINKEVIDIEEIRRTHKSRFSK